MGLRKNNFQGHDSRIVKHGHWLKKKTYINTGFRQVPDLTAEEKRKKIEEKLKPYSLDLTKHVPLEAAHGGTDSFAPPTPSYSVTISPTSAEEFSNVVLSATTDLTSPSFVWTLTDFKDTSGNYVTSYTGNPLTEGYFTSSGSSNVSVVATGDEGSATGSTFSVTAIDYILDTFTGASFAYEGRKLSASSTYAYRVRRSSDNTEQDIGFVGKDLDTASLLSFVGTSGTDNGYVVKFYDQSGNNRDLTNTSASSQPIIVQAGALVSNNGLVGAYYDGVNDSLDYYGSLGFTGKDMDIFFAAKKDTNHLYDGAIIASNNYRMDVRSDGFIQVDSGNILVGNYFSSFVFWSGVTTGYARREQFNSGYYLGGDLIPNQYGPWTATTLSDLSQNFLSIGRRGDGALDLWGWAYGAVGYNQRSSVNLIDAWQVNQANYYVRPSISGETSPVVNTSYDYQVENGLFFSADTFNWSMGDTWVGATTGQTISGYFSADTAVNISVENSSALISLSATKNITPTT